MVSTAFPTLLAGTVRHLLLYRTKNFLLLVMRVLSSTLVSAACVAAACDADLVRALAQDDEKAFAEIYERYWQPLLRQATRKLNRP